MSKTQIALVVFIVLFSWIVPYIVQKYKIKDNIKFKNTLPVGTAQFRAFLKLVGWILFGLLVLSLVVNSTDLLDS